MMSTLVFPTAVAHLVANRLNNIFFASNADNRVSVSDPRTIKLDAPPIGVELDIINQHLVDYNGQLM